SQDQDRPRAASRDRDRGALRCAVDRLLQVVEDPGRGLARRDGHGARLEGRAAAVVARALRHDCVRRAAVVDAVAALGHVARACGGPAHGRALGVGGAVRGRAGGEVVRVAHAGRGAAHGGRGLEGGGGAIGVDAVTALGLVAGAGGGPALVGALGVGGAVRGRARAEVIHVAGAGRGPAQGGRGLEVVGGTVVVDAVTALGVVAGAGGGPALVGALAVGGAVRGRAGAEVVQVAHAGRGAAQGGRGLEVVSGPVAVDAVAALGLVAGAGGRPALGRALGVSGAVGGRARA